MNSIQHFKEDLWNGIINHQKRMSIPSLAVGLIGLPIFITLLFVVVKSLILTDEIIALYASFIRKGVSDQESVQIFINELEIAFASIDQGRLATGFAITYALGILFSSWMLNFLLICSEDIVLTGKFNLGEAFKSSFNHNLPKLIGFSIVMLIVSLFLSFFGISLVQANFGLFFIAQIFIMVVTLRFIATPSAIVHGQMSLYNAIAFSLSHITFKRSFKLILVGFVFSIVLLLVYVLLGAALSMLGSIGSAVFMILHVPIFVICTNLMISGVSAIFFRYADVEIESDEASHLVEDL